MVVWNKDVRARLYLKVIVMPKLEVNALSEASSYQIIESQKCSFRNYITKSKNTHRTNGAALPWNSESFGIAYTVVVR